jgi:hypothetical protein
MNDSSSTKAAHRRYKRELWIALAIYTAFVFGGSYGVRYLEWPHWAVIAASLAPLLPALMMLRAYATFLRDIDEFQRRVHTDAILISAAIVGFSSFAYGFLEEWASFPHLPLIWVLPALIGIWGLAACIIRLRYK